MVMKLRLTALLVSAFIVSACGGGGGGGVSALLGGGVSTPTYNYSTIDSRYANNTVSQFDSTGIAVAQTYNQEAQNSYISRLELGSSDLSYSIGTDAYGDTFIQIDISKYYSSTPEGLSTPNEYILNYDISFTGNQVNTLYDAPNFLYVTKYFSNATLRMYGLNDSEAYAGTKYVDMLIWNMHYNNGYNDLVSFAFGDKTFDGDMPSSTSATYNVKSMGFWVSNGTVLNYHGGGSLTADFQNMTLTGEIINDYLTGDPYSWSQIAGGSAGGIVFDGTISGSKATGTIDWGNGYGAGVFDASFFGPKAQEIGGSYAAYADEDKFDNHISGTFIGVK